VQMIADQDTELGVHRLLLHGLRDLDSRRGDEWPLAVEQMTAQLLGLDDELSTTLAAVVRASVVIQEFLLEVAVLSVPQPADRQAIFDMVAWLLDNLNNHDHDATPSVYVPASPAIIK
jgi:hypothetical protein